MALIKKSMLSYSTITEKLLLTCRCLAIIAAIAAPVSTAITSAACVAMLLTWLISGQVWQGLKISAGQPAGKMLLLFFAWLIISSLYADTSWSDKVTTLSSWKKLFYHFCVIRSVLPDRVEKALYLLLFSRNVYCRCYLLFLCGYWMFMLGRGEKPVFL